GLLGGDVFTHPHLAQTGGVRLRRTTVESMRLFDRAERPASRTTLIFVAARQLPRRTPGRVGLHRPAACEELPEHRVIHPCPRTKAGPNHLGLRQIRSQHPGPHMCRRALRSLTRPQPPPRYWGDLVGRMRYQQLRHTTAVEAATDMTTSYRRNRH